MVIFRKLNREYESILSGKNKEFIYENDLMKLKAFQKQENLDILLRDATTELEKIILLRDWTHHQIHLSYYGKPYYNVPIDASTRLNLLRNKLIKGICGSYAFIFVQACLSMNIIARSIHISRNDGQGHEVTDAWDKENKRWILIDPTFNIAFYKAKIELDKINIVKSEDIEGPLNIIDLHNYSRTEKIKNLVMYNVMFGYTGLSDFFKKWMIEYYSNFFIRMRNNFITNNFHTTNDDINAKIWEDEKSNIEEFLWEEY